MQIGRNSKKKQINIQTINKKRQKINQKISMEAKSEDFKETQINHTDKQK